VTDDDSSFIRMVVYFWADKGDPTRYTDWDEARCKQLMPEFHRAWKKMCRHRATLDRIVNELWFT
jgi:hypothetical protein